MTELNVVVAKSTEPRDDPVASRLPLDELSTEDFAEYENDLLTSDEEVIVIV